MKERNGNRKTREIENKDRKNKKEGKEEMKMQNSHIYEESSQGYTFLGFLVAFVNPATNVTVSFYIQMLYDPKQRQQASYIAHTCPMASTSRENFIHPFNKP